MQLSPEELRYYREQLAGLEVANKALDVIEEAEGDLEDAATTIALAVGQNPDRIDWLDGWAKRCRAAICQEKIRQDLENNYLASAVKCLLEEKICPPLLLTPLLIYVVKKGVSQFCKPLSYQLNPHQQ
ncbi:MAG: hypothetical protein NZ901_10220 [Geminocystis sp.]|nr:hypothetical protein [Geminocystis sp.]MCS7148550.1 hypothetical protein [Geminocystis sp.]MDW8114877.1 hypothetical protein [Geminocystis sp.]MDW8464143.1 hypothetical protein [Geminocystis sp.]